MALKIIFLLIISLGIIFRIYQVDTIPSGMFADETALAINAKTIAETGKDEFGRFLPFGFESFSDYKMPGYIYLDSLFYKVVGPSLLTVRLPAIISGLISIGLLGYLTRILFPRKKYLPYISMCVLAISPYHIHFSRIAYETMVATTFFLLYLIALIKVIEAKKKFLWIIVGCIGIIGACWTYPAPRFIIPIVTVLFITYISLSKEIFLSKKAIITAYCIFLLTIAITFLPTLLNPVMDKRPLGYVLTGNYQDNIFSAILGKVLTITSSFLRIFNFEFLFQKGDLFAFRHGTKENGIFLSIFALPLIAGIFAFIKEYDVKKYQYPFLVIIFLICGLPSALTSSTPYGPRLLPMILPLSLLVAFGIDSIMHWYKQVKITNYIKKSIVGIILFIFAFQVFHYTHIYFVHFKSDTLAEFQKPGDDVIVYIRNQQLLTPKKTIYFLNGRGCLPWGYTHLKLWYYVKVNNDDMFRYNNEFREKRYGSLNPFDSFDRVINPKVSLGNIILHAPLDEVSKAPNGSIIIRCSVDEYAIDKNKERIEKIFYLYEEEKRDPMYIVTFKEYN